MLRRRSHALACIAALSTAALLSSCAALLQPTRADAPAAELEALVEAMGQRLAVMPRVAEWKRAHDRPVRDRPRELVVLDHAVEAVQSAAEEAGVEPFDEAEVRRFYQAQIDAAVAIQEHVMREAADPQDEPPDLVTELRPELDRLGKRIAGLLVLQTPAPDRSYLEQLAGELWTVAGLEPEKRQALVDALERLLNGDRS